MVLRVCHRWGRFFLFFVHAMHRNPNYTNVVNETANETQYFPIERTWHLSERAFKHQQQQQNRMHLEVAKKIIETKTTTTSTVVTMCRAVL